MKSFLLFLIHLYQKTAFLRKAFTKTAFGVENYCKFNPSCSQYTYDSIKKYGSMKGIVLGLSRFSKCHPFSKS